MLLWGCTPVYDVPTKPQLVVEGWIGSGENPVVLLSQIIPLMNERDTTNLYDVAVRWGKVTISDGTESEVMIGRRNENYLTQFYYTTLRMKGEVGKTYTIYVEYDGIKAHATTMIPPIVSIDKLSVEQMAEKYSSYMIHAEINDPTGEQNYYKTSARPLGDDEVYRPTTMGVWNDKTIGNELPIYRYFELIAGEKSTIYYSKNDTIDVRLEHIDQIAYDYWSDCLGNFLNMGNPISPFYSNIRGNVEGALGIWYGYGSSTRRVIIH